MDDEDIFILGVFAGMVIMGMAFLVIMNDASQSIAKQFCEASGYDLDSYKLEGNRYEFIKCQEKPEAVKDDLIFLVD